MDYIKLNPYYPRQQQILNMYVKEIEQNNKNESLRSTCIPFNFGKRCYDSELKIYYLELLSTIKMFCYEDSHTYIIPMNSDDKRHAKEDFKIKLVLGNEVYSDKYDGYVVEKEVENDDSFSSKMNHNSNLNCLVCNNLNFYIKRNLVELSKKELKFGISDYSEFCKKYALTG